MENLERAISIRQPFIELILIGKKKYEYRTINTRIRGRVYLYASKSLGKDPSDWKNINKSPEELPKGCIVGSVEILDSTWNEKLGCYQYKLKNPKRYDEYLYPKNQPNPVFWRPVF